MQELARRDFLAALAGLAAAGPAPRTVPRAKRAAASSRKVPMLHSTDLFRPHMDPDDHWDLACVYSLAYLGHVELKGILIDFPPGQRDPDALAVSQMNYITHLAAPLAVGPAARMRSRRDGPRGAASDQNAVRLVLDVLRASGSPVVINITGCARTIAAAGKLEPRLFKEKCAAVYLNAGTGSPDKALASRLEYNVTLDPAAYAAIFDLRCPVYWMPCFERMDSARVVREFGTFHRFRQGEILPHLSDMMQNYFAHALGRIEQSSWLRRLLGPRDRALLDEQGGLFRNMWCTAGFLHAAGRTVTASGDIVALGEAPADPVFTFDPVRVSCDDAGVTQWTMDKGADDRYIFHVRDIDNYQSAMTAATRSLLTSLP